MAGSGLGFDCGADPGGTLGLVFGVFGGMGFDGAGVGTAGGGFGIDGDAGGDVCWVQPAAIALSAMAVKIKVDLVAFILRSCMQKNAR